jgi:O-antigen/teichoic acid export membrane protein
VNVLALALFFAALVSLVLAAPVLVVPAALAAALGRPAVAPYLWLLPVAIFLAASYSALQFWAVRRKAFRPVAVTRVAQSAAAAGTQIGLGFAGAGPLGLLLALALNSGAGAVGLLGRFVSRDGKLAGEVTPARMRAAFREQVRFPKFSALEAVCNSASIFLPVVLIAAYAPAAQAGFVMLAMQVMQAPMSLIGNAVAQVYMSQAPAEHRAGSLGTFTAGILGGLMRTGVGPLLFAGIVAAPAFAIVFGAKWREAGLLVAWMTPWFVMQFLSSPVSMSLHVTGNQKAALVLQMLGLVVRGGAVVAAIAFAPGYLPQVYAVSGFVFYAIYVATVLRYVQTRAGDLRRELVRFTPWGIGWVMLAIVSLAVAEALL